MTKRKITKASKIRLSVFAPLCLIAIISFSFSLLYNAYSIYTLSNEKQKLESTYTSLQDEAKNLKIDIQKFKDPEYLANYAREHYLYSKDGEYILQLGENATETKETINTISTQINRAYIILSLVIVMLFVFVYILKKGRLKKYK